MVVKSECCMSRTIISLVHSHLLLCFGPGLSLCKHSANHLEFTEASSTNQKAKCHPIASIALEYCGRDTSSTALIPHLPYTNVF